MTGFEEYSTDGFYDEMFAPDGSARPAGPDVGRAD